MSEPILKLPLTSVATTIRGCDGYPVTPTEAREIVRRCNAFDALLAACVKAEYAFRVVSGERDEVFALAALREAIAASTKEAQ